MTRIQLTNIVETHNRPIKSQRDMQVSKLLLTLVERICRSEGWKPEQFFKQGTENELTNDYEEWFQNYIWERNISDDDVSDVEDLFWADPDRFIREENCEDDG